MTNPTSATIVPHLLGITLDGTGLATSNVVALNRTNGEYLILATNASKVVVFDAANFTSGYSAGDVIQFNNVGASVGQKTITINSDTGGFQDETIITATASTVAVNL